MYKNYPSIIFPTGVCLGGEGVAVHSGLALGCVVDLEGGLADKHLVDAVCATIEVVDLVLDFGQCLRLQHRNDFLVHFFERNAPHFLRLPLCDGTGGYSYKVGVVGLKKQRTISVQRNNAIFINAILINAILLMPFLLRDKMAMARTETRWKR